MDKFIADSRVILSVAGLRYVAKDDYVYGGLPEKYGLKWSYKGRGDSIRYETKEARDAMYDKIVKALVPGV